MSARQLNRLLAEAGLQTKQGHLWSPMPEAQGGYRLFDTRKRQGSGTPVTQTQWAENVLLGTRATGAGVGMTPAEWVDSTPRYLSAGQLTHARLVHSLLEAVDIIKPRVVEVDTLKKR